MSYSYWLIRYVPDALRGEFVNIGVLVGRDSGDWALRRARSFRRANRLGGDASRAEAWLTSLERYIYDHQHPPLDAFLPEGRRAPSTAQVAQMSRRLNNAIQISDPVPVEGQSAGDAAEFLYQFLVMETAAPARSATRRRLLTHLRDQYLEIGHLDPEKNLERSVRAEVGRQRGRFDFAVLDDDVSQLSQVWSFDIADVDKLEQDIQAWSYMVTRIRDSGGHLAPKSSKRSDSLLMPVRIASDVPIAAVYQLPESSPRRAEQTDVFHAAQEAWQGLGVQAVPSSEMQRVAFQARRLVSA